MRELPFTAEILESVVGSHVLAVWPLPVVAPLLALLALGLVLKPASGGGRMAAALLAAAWAGVGIDFHIKTAAAIDFLAPVYGAFFLVQAALLIWAGVLRGHFANGFRHDTAGWSGLVLAVLAIVGYPLLALASGRSWPSLPIVGVTPDPTVMLTFGMILIAAGRRSRLLLAVPVLWSLVAGVTAWLLETPERLLLPAAAVACIAILARPRSSRRSRGCAV